MKHDVDFRDDRDMKKLHKVIEKHGRALHHYHNRLDKCAKIPVQRQPGVEVRIGQSTKDSSCSAAAVEQDESPSTTTVTRVSPSSNLSERYYGPKAALERRRARINRLPRASSILGRRIIAMPSTCYCADLPQSFRTGSRFPSLEDWPGSRHEFFVHVTQVLRCSGHSLAMREHCHSLWEAEQRVQSVRHAIDIVRAVADYFLVAAGPSSDECAL